MHYLLKLHILAITALCIFSISSSANIIYPGRCFMGTSHESYGFGLNSGFTGKISRGNMNDEFCFKLGQNEGQKLRNTYSEFPNNLEFCQDDYKDAYAQGLNADILVIGDHSDCSHSGYIYGLSALANGARGGDTALVGQDCVNAYQQGLRDGRSHSSNGSYLDNRESACYQTGFSDGDL